MPPKKKIRETRAEIFLVGHPEDKPRSVSKPLTNGDMLRYLHYRKNLDNSKAWDWDTVSSCAMGSGTRTACCSKDCRAEGSKSLCGVSFARVTGCWNSTGIPLKSDLSLKLQINTLLKEWQGINKKKSRLSKANLSTKDQELVDNFVTKLNQTFMAASPDAEEIIMKDKLRDSKQKEEDISFLRSMKKDRVGTVACLDKVYQKRFEDKKERQEREIRKQEKYQESKSVTEKELDVNGNEEDFEYGNDDKDYVEASMSNKQRKRERKIPEKVAIEVPRNIVQVLAPTCSRYKVSHTALSSILLQTVSVGGGDINSLPLSRRQVERNSKVSVEEYASEVREAFVLEAKSKLFVCHFDGKQLADYTDGVKRTKERMTVVVSSPDLEHPHVLGSIALGGQTGEEIADGVLSLWEEYQICDRIIGLSFDTTASNTGPSRGACVRLERELGKGLLWLACRRHVMELHIKHVAQMVAKEVGGRDPNSPGEPLFKKLQDDWPTLLSVIAMENLVKFDWQEVAGTELEAQAQNSLEILSHFLRSGTFPREDYRELCELTVLYLGGAVPGFKFQYPGAFHHARYMSKAIYMLKLRLLMNKITWLKDAEMKEVKIMAEFIGVFYVVWWLRAYIGVKAPVHDLTAVGEMRMYRRYNQRVAETCLSSLFRHTWYLTEELIVLCLVDTNCTDRDEVAAAVLDQEKLDEFHPRKPKLPKIEESIWPDNGKLPSMAQFVGPRSRLIFSLLQLSASDLDWLQFSSEQWDMFSGYKKFAMFVRKLAVVNDAGERGVKAIQEVVGRTTSESMRQDMLVTHSEERKKFPNIGPGHDTKSKLAKL